MHRQAVSLLLLAAACAQPPAREDEISPDDTGTLEQALLACPGAATVQGIDVSSYQPNTDWAQVAGSGRKFAIIKATEATGYVNAYFARDWAQTKQNGMIRGAYHFFRPSYDGVAQADHFVDTMGALGPGDLPPMLDLEVTDGQSAATVVSRMNAFLNRVEQRTGKKPLIYVGFYFWRDTIGNPQGYKQYPLVIAAYVSPCPQVPDQWGTFTMWQYTSTGTVPGVSGNVDHDLFNGTLAQLQALAGISPVVPVRAHDFASIGNGQGYTLMGNGTLKAVGGAAALATGVVIADDLGRSLALRSDHKSGWVLDAHGALHAFGGAPAMTGPTFTVDIARQVVLRGDEKSGYVLDGAGAMHPFGGAPALTGLPAWPGQDLARDVVLRADDTSGYLLDAWGGFHPFGGAPAASPPPPGYTTGQDVARALVLGFDQESGYVLQKSGMVYAFGGAPAVVTHPAFAGDGARGFSLDDDGVSGVAVDADGVSGGFSADVVKDISLNAEGKGYVLLGSGALKPVGGAAAVTDGPSWPAQDIARRVVVRADGKSGWVLDSAGAIHPFGGAAAVTGAGSWPGQDQGRGLTLDPAGVPSYELDSWGGIHPLNGVPAMTAYPYWSGKDFARDLVLRADGTTGYTLDREGGMGPVGGAPALKNLPAWPGMDVARRAVLLDDGVSGWILDSWGAVHAFGDAPPTWGGPWWPRWNVATGLVVDGSLDRVRILDAYGRLHAISLRPQVVLAEPPVATLAVEPMPVDPNGLPLEPFGSNPTGTDPNATRDPNDPNTVAGTCAAVPLLAPWLVLTVLGAVRRRRRSY